MRQELALPYFVVDVFTSRPLEGNALAVFPDAARLDAGTMQRIACELNLAETTFVLPATRADCAARVRIFTPRKEMTFAGHPTIGTAFVLREQGMLVADGDWFNLEEGVGPVPVRIDASSPPRIWLRTPAVVDGPSYAPDLCARVLSLATSDLLGVQPQLLSAGNPTIFVALCNPEAVDRAWLSLEGMRTLRGADEELRCVFVFARTSQGVYSRMFAPEYGISEDPATGSSTGPLAVYMMRHGLLPSAHGTTFVSEQGAKMGRRSFLHVEIHGEGGTEGIVVGGHVTPLARGVMHLGLKA